jgi:hypothetical protein
MPEPAETAGHSPGHGSPGTHAARCGLRRPYPDAGTKVVPPPGALARISLASRSSARSPTTCMSPEIFRDATANSSEARGPAGTDAGQGPWPGGRSDLVPLGQLIGQKAGCASGRVDRRGAQRCGRDRGDGGVPVARGRGTRTLPESAGEAAVLGAHVASRSSRRPRPRPAARQPDPDLRDCW